MKWDQLRWIEHPLGALSTFRIRSTVGPFAIYGLSESDRVRLFEVFEDQEVMVGRTDPLRKPPD